MARVIPQEAVEELTRQINTVSASMQQGLLEQLQKFDLNDMSQFEAVEQLMQLYCAGATDASALLAAEFYDASREYCIGEPMNAAAVSQRVPEATRVATLGIMADTKDRATVAAQLAARLDYEIKRAAGDCTFYNGSRDRARPYYARVPSGSETCAFCLMLASRGFVYRSEKSAGALDHYHPHCDCRVVAGWGDNPQVGGYDPDAIYRRWGDVVDAEAREKAEKNGTTVDQEKSKIYKRLEEGARKAKQRAKSR